MTLKSKPILEKVESNRHFAWEILRSNRKIHWIYQGFVIKTSYTVLIWVSLFWNRILYGFLREICLKNMKECEEKMFSLRVTKTWMDYQLIIIQII